MVFFLIIFTPLPHCGYTWFFATPSPPPPQEPRGIFKGEKWVFTCSLFTSQKNTGYHYYLPYFMKETRYNVNHWVSIANGDRKGDWERREGAGEDPKKMLIQRLRFLCAGSHYGFSQKRPRVSFFFFFFFLDPPPLLFFFFFFLWNPPSPLNGPRGLCTVP